MTTDGSSPAKGIACFSLTTADAPRLSAFYRAAFGCQIVKTERVSGGDFERLMDVQGGAARTMLSLGDQMIELLQFDRPGHPYPADSTASDLIFQHFAVVVSDMAQAYTRLCATPHWTPISVGGPQRLPQSSGGVTAFKFRDPEGHPLELLAFAENNVPAIWRTPKAALCLGIDHSAISVSDIAASVGFYESLGFAVTGQSINEGAAQQNLDDIADVHVVVAALSINHSSPHLELLCYAENRSSGPVQLRNNDLAATRSVLTSGNANQIRIFDPDGHHFVMA